MRLRWFTGASTMVWVTSAIVGIAILVCPVGTHRGMIAAGADCAPTSHNLGAAALAADTPGSIVWAAPARSLLAFALCGAAGGRRSPGAIPGSVPSSDRLFGRLTI